MIWQYFEGTPPAFEAVLVSEFGFLNVCFWHKADIIKYDFIMGHWWDTQRQITTIKGNSPQKIE
jgi:hypothetical protein